MRPERSWCKPLNRDVVGKARRNVNKLTGGLPRAQPLTMSKYALTRRNGTFVRADNKADVSREAGVLIQINRSRSKWKGARF